MKHFLSFRFERYKYNTKLKSFDLLNMGQMPTALSGLCFFNYLGILCLLETHKHYYWSEFFLLCMSSLLQHFRVKAC